VTTICVSFLVFGKPWNGYHMAGLLLFVCSVSAERFGVGGSSRRFAVLLLTSSSFIVLRFLAGGFGPSAFSVVIDAGSAGTRLNVFRFDAWTMKLLDIDGRAQVFLEEEPGISDLFENASALQQQMERLLDAAVAAVPHAQRGVTPLSVRATTSLEQLDMDQVQDLMEGMKHIVSHAGFKDGGVQAMSGDAEADAEWLTVNMLLSVFKPGMQGVRDPVAVMDLGGATLQMAYYLADHDVSRAKRQLLDAYIQRINLPFGSGNVHVYRHSYIGYGLITAKVKSFKYAEKAGFALERHPCLPHAAQASMRDYRTQLEAKGALDKPACVELVDYLLRKDLPCLQEPGRKEQFLGRASNPAFGNCSFAGVWAGPGTGSQRVVLKSYFYDRMRDASVIAPGVLSAPVQAGTFAAQADRACSAAAQSIEALAQEFPGLSKERLIWLCFDLTFQARILLNGLGFPEAKELLVVKKLLHNDLQIEASWALGHAMSQLISRELPA